jgi:hypothetical protein
MKQMMIMVVLLFGVYASAEDAAVTKQQAIKSCKAEGNKGVKLKACVKLGQAKK